MAEGSAKGAAWAALRLKVLDRDGWTCQLCGKPLEKGPDATADHIVAKKNGGEDALYNLRAACRSCNSIKGARVLVRSNYYDPTRLDHL
jgi:5-methylcytosine-specific restriction protein A